MEEKEPARRVRTALSLECGVCRAPAPDHLHFGGKQQGKYKDFLSLLGSLWGLRQQSVKSKFLVREVLTQFCEGRKCLSKYWKILYNRSLLLFLPGLFPSYMSESEAEGPKEMQDRSRSLRRLRGWQELCQLSLQQMSQHWDDPGPASG